MSNRTAESLKAIRQAWKNEQERVLDGKGTRDWTVEQQNDIINKGKAYDEDGIAFQGQHMKSAEKYPEYQNDPGNIQFLTRAEHLEAHGGNWRNPTNWYFNPSTKERIDFGDGPFIPCSVIDLSEPVAICTSDTSDVHAESESNKKEEFDAKSSDQAPPQAIDAHINLKSEQDTVIHPVASKPLDFFSSVAKWGHCFSVEHPLLAKGLKIMGAIAVGGLAFGYTASKAASGSGTGGSSNDAETGYSDYLSSLPESEKPLSIDRDYPDTHASPKEHIVPAGGQHYHTKDGVIWKEKEAYRRGGKKNDDDL
jgi:hypothetical protein